MDTSQMNTEAIADWMSHAIDTAAEYDDLHIDQIDRKYKAPLLWIDAGIDVLSEAIRLRSFYHYAVSITLVFSLRGGPKKIGVNFTTKVQLEENFGYMPPSLYLFKIGHEPWNSNQINEIEIAHGLDGIDFPTNIKRIFYFEFKPPLEDNYSRSFCIEA
jgi:hypothetical protein